MNNKNKQEMQNRFSLRKLTIGLASVSLGMFFMQTSNQVKAATPPAATTVTKEAGQPGQTTPKDNSTVQKLVTPAKDQSLTNDTTTPIAPSKIVPSYDDKNKKVVSTPFYNNPQGTNSKLIDNKSNTGQYTFYFTARDASGKEYASSYAAEKGNPKEVVLNSILNKNSILDKDALDKDTGAYDPNSLEYHFYYQNNTAQDQAINYTLRMADFLAPFKPGSESSLVPDGSRINEVKVISKQGNTYDISSITKSLDKSQVGDVPVNLTVKANDAINLVIPFVLNTTAKKSTDWIDDHNEFSVRENGQQTGYMVVRSSTYAPLFPGDKIYPEVKVENNYYTHEYPGNPGAFDLGPFAYRNNDFMDDIYASNDPITSLYNASKPTNKSTVYGTNTYTFFIIGNYEKKLINRGFSVPFDVKTGKPVQYYMYTLGHSRDGVVDKNGNPVHGSTKGLPYFEVVPVILLNQDETYTTKTAPTAWDPSTMVNKVADPTNYSYWDQKTNSAVRRDNTAPQLTAKDFKVTITKDGQPVKPDANGKYDLSKPGTYTVTYSRDFNGTTISNSGQITVTPVEEPDKPSGNNNNNSNHNNNNNNGNNDNKGGNHLDAIVPVNPSDNNSNTAPTDNDTDTSKPTDNNTDTSKPTDNKKTDDIKKDNTGKKITKKTPKKVKNNKSNKTKSTTTSKSNQSSKTKRTTQTKKPTRTNRTDDISPKANVMNMTKRTTKSGTISPKAVALANTTAGPATSAKANMENGIAKNNSQNSQTLPQTGENESKVVFAVAGLLAAGIGLFALAIDRKRSK